MKRQTAFERDVRFVAKRLDDGYPLTPELRVAIADLVSAAARSARAERGAGYWENDKATKEES